MSEYTKYDSDDEFRGYGVRLAKDAEVIETKNGSMTKITFVSTSSNEDDEDMWIEGIVNDGQAEKAQGLQKGDVLMSVVGKLTSKLGRDGDKVFYNLKRVRLHFGIELLTSLKERGGKSKPAGKGKGTPAKGGTQKAKPAAKKTAAKKPERPIIEDDEDEDDGDEE